jgi:hypothetical protein
MNNDEKKKCILCKKTIKKFAKWNDNKQRSVHRKCWLNFRDFGDRHFDYLFCGDRKKNNGKHTILKPTSVLEENVVLSHSSVHPPNPAE